MINKTLLKKLKQTTNPELVTLAQSYKIQNRAQEASNSKRFQTNYNTIINELKERNLIRETK